MAMICLISKIGNGNNMSHTLIINPGSSSIKWKTFDCNLNVVVSGVSDKLTLSTVITLNEGNNYSYNMSNFNPNEVINQLKKILVDYNIEISKVGVRVVHGGLEYSHPVDVNHAKLFQMKELIGSLAPLHNPLSLSILEECLINFDEASIYADFDTSFHNTIPQIYNSYAISTNISRENGIRRFGFHGISYQNCLYQLQENLKNIDIQNKKGLLCHLGSGSSICAVDKGKSIMCSMGYEPNEGLIMGTRSGDFSTAVVQKLALKSDLSAVLELLNNNSGLLGISGYSSDMRVLLSDYHNNPSARLAVDMFTNKILQYIGGYMLLLGGIDYLVFTGSIGNGSPFIRKRVASALSLVGAKLNENLNEIENDLAGVHPLHAVGSTLDIYSIKTDEERQIAMNIK